MAPAAPRDLPIEANGVTLAAQAFGRTGGSAILLVMGATASMLGWPDALCEGLASRGHFVVRYDHRDTGLSRTCPPGEPDYAVEDLAGDLVGVLDAFGIGRAHVVGMSLGGYVGQMAALDRPERIASLTLVGCEPLGWDGAPLPHIAPAFLEHFAAAGSLDWSDRPAVAAFLLGIERLCAGSAWPFDEAAARTRIDAVLARSPSIASAFNHGALVARRDWSGRFRGIALPVLVIHGSEDPILPPANGRALAAGIPGARLVELDGIGHELPAPILPRLVDTLSTFVAAAGGR